MFPEFADLCTKSNSGLNFQTLEADDNKLCQFILDPTSLNLPQRINLKEPNLESFFRKSRDFCYSVHNKRMNILKQRSEKEAK